MGMAASQARLLTLTSRLHDIEYKAQNIESQKIALATQKDELYQAYCDALDATKIQVKFYDGAGTKYVDANFSTLCDYCDTRVSQYSLRDSKSGKVIVDEQTAENYDTYDNDKYSFAWAMMGFETTDYCWNGDDRDGSVVGTVAKTQNSDEPIPMTEVEQMVYDNHASETGDDATEVKDAFTEYNNTLTDGSTPAEQQEALDKFREVLYDKYADEIYDYMRYSKQDDKDKVIANNDYNTLMPEEFNQKEFNYYVHLFENIQASGGYEIIDSQYKSGDLGNEWFNNMVSCGRVLIDLYDDDTNEWNETSVATSTNENNLQEMQDDTDLKKAEAEYEHELDVINTKDTKFDNDLSKLETERTAITTEIDSISQVRDDNIERTFGIFS